MGFPPTQRIGRFVYEEFEHIDVFGFAEAFTIARFLGRLWRSAALSLCCDADRVWPGRGKERQRSGGPARLGHGPGGGRSARGSDDPGGSGTWPLLDAKAESQRVAALLDWVQWMDGKVNLMTSVCTGAAVLARAGLLDGRPAATNHGAFAWLTEQGPKVLWDSVSRGARRRPLRDIRQGLRGNAPRLLYWFRGSPVAQWPKTL